MSLWIIGLTLIETFEYFIKCTANSKDSQKISRSSLCFILGMIAHFVTVAWSCSVWIDTFLGNRINFLWGPKLWGTRPFAMHVINKFHEVQLVINFRHILYTAVANGAICFSLRKYINQG